ncbi:hypothetical protein LEM8419_01673 [Neolewinella maritima]|uniref:Uncharacterized protein n=1 Tax=Neolewinella maritima TaxID=1383882 RepID=A0ABM9B143_9BACT|nr:hypothetical protein [Neolewinella maritima]CAH1000520.1 hypothetical protein LEM8419_01673 [Neolewinella maritima]
MKQLLVLLLLSSTCLVGQQTATIKDGTTTYDKKTLPSMTIQLDAPVDRVYDVWDDFWDERYDIDIDRTDKDNDNIAYLAEQVALRSMGDKRMDVYSSVGGTKERAMVNLSLAYSDTDVVTATNHAGDYRTASALLQEFRTYFYQRYFDGQLNETQEELADLRDDSQDASKDAEKAREKIAKYEDKIEKLRRKIEDTREDVGDELQTAEEKSRRVRELEEKLQELRLARKKYLG